jgi:hypothetical protein
MQIEQLISIGVIFIELFLILRVISSFLLIVHRIMISLIIIMISIRIFMEGYNNYLSGYILPVILLLRMLRTRSVVMLLNS